MHRYSERHTCIATIKKVTNLRRVLGKGYRKKGEGAKEYNYVLVSKLKKVHAMRVCV